jgi:hypothetical protein
MFRHAFVILQQRRVGAHSMAGLSVQNLQMGDKTERYSMADKNNGAVQSS